MASQVEALYKYMTDNKLYNGSVNDFQRELSNPKTANSVFNYLSKNKLYTGDYKSFASETNAYIETPATDDYSTLKSSVNKGLSFINTDIEKNPRTIKTPEETTYFAPSSPTTMINPFKTESPEKEIEFKKRDEIKEMLYDAEKKLDQYEYNQSGKANFIKNAGKGAADASFDIDTWTFGMSELSKSATARAINQQLEKGKKYEDLSKLDQSYLDAMATNTAVAAFTEGKLGRGYTAGKTAAESIPFMLSMYMNPASGLGKALQGLATEKLASIAVKGSAKILPKIVSGTARVGGDIISSAVLANTTQASSTMADYQSRMLGTPTHTYTDEGEIRFNQFVGGEKDASTAFLKAQGAATIENFSEMAGMYLDAIPGFKQGIAKLALGKGKNIKLISKIDDFIKVADKNNAVRTFNNFQDRVNWNGLFNEYAEELFGTAANATFVGDEKYSDLVDLDKQIDTFLSLSVTAGVMSGVQTGSFVYTGLNGAMMRNKAISRAKTQFEGHIWNSLRKDIDDAGVDNIGDELNKIFQRTDLNKDQKITALQYATGTAYAYGEDVAQEKNRYESLGFNNSERNITKRAAEIKIGQELNKKANESTRTKEDFLIQEVELSDGRTGFVKKGNLTINENNNIDFENSDKDIVVDIEGKLTPIAVNGSGLSVSKLLNSSSAKQEFANTLSAKDAQIDVMYDFPEGGNVYLIDPNTGQVMPDKGTILEFTDKGLKVKIAEPTGESEVEVPYVMANSMLTSDEKIKHQKETVYKKGEVIRGSGKVSIVIKEELDNGMYLIDTYDEDMNIIPQLSDQTFYGDEIRQALAIAPTEQAPTIQGTEQAPTIQGTEQAPTIQGMEENPDAQVPQQENEPDFDNMDEDSIVEFLSQEDNEVTTPFVEGRISTAISAAKKAEKLKIDTTTFSTAKQSAEIKKKTIELAEAERRKWSNIKAKLAEKKVVATAETLNKQKREETRKKTIASANEKFALIQDKWQNAPRFEGSEYEFTLANNQKISGRYILTEANAPTASHDPFNSYQKSEGFPLDEKGNSVNDRDYEHEPQARQQVEQHAANYNSKAVETPVFVSKDGVVISGNDRTMASQIAAVNGTDTKYVEHITKYADRFGFTEEQIKSLENPRVVFEVSEDLPYNANTFSMFNAEDKKTQHTTAKAVK